MYRVCEQSRKRKLRELYNYTALLNAGQPLQLHDWVISDEPSEQEARYLDQNDIAKYVLTSSICFNFSLFHLVGLRVVNAALRG